MLTPVRGDKYSPQDLSEMLRHAANDGEEFERMVEDILAGLDITPEDGQRLAEELKHARHDDEKMMELLRKAQDIPRLYREQDRPVREQLRQRILDEIREFERSNDGAMVLANFNAAPVAATTSEPASFLQTYTELVTAPRTFTAALKLLLSRYRFDALDGVLDNLKKALADDLGAATPSHDTRRLGAVLSDLGHMAMSSSLVDRVKDLLRLVRRAEEKKRNGGGRGGRGRGEQDEADDEEDGNDMNGRARRGPAR
jgi:type III secretion system YopN/LcrE/InvE/MxiC family regulator